MLTRRLIPLLLLLLACTAAHADVGTTYSYSVFTAPNDMVLTNPTQGFSVPHSTVATGINNSGEIVGFYQVANTYAPAYHGFSTTDGVHFTQLDVPGSYCEFLGFSNRLTLVPTTQAFSIDNSGEIKGIYQTDLPWILPDPQPAKTTAGFEEATGTGNYLTTATTPTMPLPLAITLPNSPWALAGYGYTVYGENDFGQLVGSYTVPGFNHLFPGEPGYNPDLGTWGFLATPVPLVITPEPGVMVLALVLIGVGVGWERRKAAKTCPGPRG